MLRIRQTGTLAAVVSALAFAMTGSALAQQSYGSAAARETLPAGTVLKVELDQRLNSEKSRPGQRFTATVRPEEDRSGLPEGTRVEGVVRAARAAAKDRPGVLDVDFTALRFPDGRTYPIQGSLTSLDSKAVTRTASGRLVSKRDSKSEKLKFIGYGAGAGALIGMLAGEDLLKGALLGAAGGYLYGQLNKDKNLGDYRNVDLKEGSEFGVRLDQRFAYAPAVYQRGSRYGETVSRRDLANGDRPWVGSGPTHRPGIGVMVNDREVSFASARPMRVGRTVLVPLAPVMNAAGVRYQYNGAAREVSVRNGQDHARLTVGSSIAWVNGRRERLEAPARIIQGTLYVPSRFLELATGLRADWDEGSQTMLLTGSDQDRFRDGKWDRREEYDRSL